MLRVSFCTHVTCLEGVDHVRVFRVNTRTLKLRRVLMQLTSSFWSFLMFSTKFQGQIDAPLVTSAVNHNAISFSHFCPLWYLKPLDLTPETCPWQSYRDCNTTLAAYTDNVVLWSFSVPCSTTVILMHKVLLHICAFGSSLDILCCFSAANLVLLKLSRVKMMPVL